MEAKKYEEFVELTRNWQHGDCVEIILPIELQFISLPDDKTIGAFRYGPEVLAGICEQERVLTIAGDDPTKELSVDTERQWGDFLTYYRTEHQEPGINFKRLSEIGYEAYQVYFKVKNNGNKIQRIR